MKFTIGTFVPWGRVAAGALTALALVSTDLRADIRSQSMTITNTSENSESKNNVLVAKEVETFEEWYKETVTWQEYVCEEEVDEGKLSDWNGFFRYRSASALASAVQGIGESRARTIVDRGYFYSKPRSWTAFAAEIWRIENDLGDQVDSMRNLYKDVVEKYGEANRTALGYDNYSRPGPIESGGDGSKSDWCGFFNVKKEEKVDALSCAVKGIGKKTAEKILFDDYGRYRGDYFQSKPRSWDSFSAEIRRIARELNLNDLPGNVLEANGYANKQALDYVSSSSPAPQPNCGWVTKSAPRWRVKTSERVIREIPVSFDLFISGAKLLSGEKEVIYASWNGSNLSINTGDALNDYSLQAERDNVYYLKGKSRKNNIRTYLSDFSVNLVKDSTGSLVLTVTDSRAKELDEKSPGHSVRVTYSITQGGGSCSKGKAIATNASATLTGGQINLSQTHNLTAGETFTVTNISFERLNTEYFSGGSGTTDTAAVKY